MTMNGNFCLILDVTEVLTWAPHMGTKRTHIPSGMQPTVLQIDRDNAAEEAKRLAAAHPDRSFAIFEAIQLAMTIEVPSHITMSGEIWRTEKRVHLVAVDEAEVPF
jgi:hypothetical protein